MKCEDLQELITALVDNEVSDQERSLVERHLRDCPRCQFVYEQELVLKRETRAAGARLGAPTELRRKILSDQSIFSATERSPKSWRGRIQPLLPLHRPALALVLIILIIFPVLYLIQTQSEPLSLAAFQIQREIAAGNVPLRETSNQADLWNWLTRSVDGKFAPMEYDLSSRHLQPVGGTVQEIDGRKVLVIVYAGKDLSVTCFTFIGTERDVPKNATIFFDSGKKIKFYAFSRDEFHAVLHREGNLICIVVSKMPVHELLAIVTGRSFPI